MYSTGSEKCGSGKKVVCLDVQNEPIFTTITKPPFKLWFTERFEIEFKMENNGRVGFDNFVLRLVESYNDFFYNDHLKIDLFQNNDKTLFWQPQTFFQ